MTQRPYQELLARLRDAFPAPVSDRKHDAYFVFSILRALDQVDDLKSEVPLLGRPRALDYAAAERAELAEEGSSVEEVARQLVGRLEGMPIWGHPRTQINVVPPPSIPSVIGSPLPAIYNPNLVSDDTSYGLMLTEAAVVAMASRLVGVRPGAGGGRVHVRRDGDGAQRLRLRSEPARLPAAHRAGAGVDAANRSFSWASLKMGLGLFGVSGMPGCRPLMSTKDI